ncbi:MAG: DUF1653 domain-containing protein [Ruminococcaceae bacterium]|nr:DUF1653 domain-containing protein [Oscillospiraceae bacterium]
MFNIECGEYLHFKGKPYLVYGTGMLDSEEYVIYRHDYGAREFWIRPTAMFKEVIERDGKVTKRFTCVSAVPDEDSLGRLIKIWSEGIFPLYHSESLEAYEIARIDEVTGKIDLAKSERYEKKES